MYIQTTNMTFFENIMGTFKGSNRGKEEVIETDYAKEAVASCAKCAKCGFANRSGSPFCRNCGWTQTTALETHNALVDERVVIYDDDNEEGTVTCIVAPPGAVEIGRAHV